VQTENQNGQPGDQAGARGNDSARGNQGQRGDRQTASANQNQRNGNREQNGESQSADAAAQEGQGGRGQRDGQTQTAQAGRGGRPTPDGGRFETGGNIGGEEGRGGNGNDNIGTVFDRFANENPGTWREPITGPGFGPWSDRLRDVEEMIDAPDLRNQVATARERARLLRQQFNRTREKPDWAVVQLQVVKPLVEVRDRIAEELARRGSEQALVPLDRDPVPNRYADLVRKYYEELGKAK